jgi:hypothetical protein
MKNPRTGNQSFLETDKSFATISMGKTHVKGGKEKKKDGSRQDVTHPVFFRDV